MKWLAPILFILIIFISSCSGEDTRRVPDTQPNIKGSITSLKTTASKNKASVAIVLVEAVEGIETNYPKANVKIDDNTIIQDYEGSDLRLGHLREGQVVEVWFEGSVMESFPIQANAAAVRVSNE